VSSSSIRYPRQQALVYERGHTVQRVERPIGVADRRDVLQRGATHEHSQPREQGLLAGAQQVVAPGQGGAQRALALRQVACPAHQFGETAPQARQQRLGREDPHMRRRQLDGQRQPVQPGADRRHVGRVPSGEGERGAHRLRALHEEGDRREARDRSRVGAVRRGGQGQRRHGEGVLAAHAQRGPAGHQRHDAGARAQQRG